MKGNYLRKLLRTATTQPQLEFGQVSCITLEQDLTHRRQYSSKIQNQIITDRKPYKSFLEQLQQQKIFFSENTLKNAKPTKLFQSRDISGKVALVTGAASGIGECSALGFAEQGCKLILLDVSQERLKKTKAQIQSNYQVDVHLISIDVTNLEQLTSSITNIPQEFKDIDILCNNVGVGFGLGPTHKFSIEEVYKMIDINVKALMGITRLVTPQMVERNSGHVINLTSSASNDYYPDFSAYCASKHAVKAFALCMQYDFLKNKVRVTNISPGYVTGSRFFNDLAKEIRETRAKIELNQGCVSVAECADTILYAATRPEHVNITEIYIQHVYEAGTSHGLK